MPEIKKKVALYISSPEDATVLRERCAPVKPMLEIGVMGTFGKEPAADSFKKIRQLMLGGEIDWVVFHLPSVSKTIGSEVFLSEIKKLIRAKACEVTATYIIDAAASMNAEGRAAFERFRVHIVDDESYIGDVFSKILDQAQLDIAQAAEEDPLFEGIVDDGSRLPGMEPSTPTKVDKSDINPFDDFDAALATEDEDPFADMEDDLGGGADDPFAAFSAFDGAFGDEPAPAATAGGDPFGEIPQPPAGDDMLFDGLDFADAALVAPAGPGAPVMAEATDPFASLDNPMPAGDDDPFASWNASSVGSGDPFDDAAPAAPAGDVVGADDLDFDIIGDDDGYDGYSGDYGDGYDDGFEGMEEPVGRMGIMTVEQLLDRYGDALSDNEYLKMKSMIEPKWDYVAEQEDGIGSGGFKLQIGKKGALKGISQVASEDLANSVYIKEVEAEKGYYSPPGESKIISVWSPKGGPGKTTVSVMLATQLNWYFNPELMQNMTTSYTARILIMSLNEFDDIPTHGIGYDEYLSEENDNDGKNVLELKRRIDETNGEPGWDDISYCFVATRANKVFYLPSLTQREQITGNVILSAADYKKILDVCSKFFSFIVLDSPDLFYHEKADIMNFAFSISDVIGFVIEPDTHSTTHLYHFFDGLRGDTNKFPLDANKCICIVNKYVAGGNVYMPVAPVGQLQFEKIAKSMSKYFARFVAIPFTQPRSYGNILDGTDPKVKYAAAELADDVLEMIDYNDEVEEKKKQHRQKRH